MLDRYIEGEIGEDSDVIKETNRVRSIINKEQE